MLSDPPLLCIAGMHRSGTSMIAGVLEAAGLFLGPQQRLMPARPDNPDGFYENLDFVSLNDRLLAAFKGAWDCPPELPAGWHTLPALESLRAEAATFGRSLHSAVPGGWKDPRNSLTIDFWRVLFPQLRVLVCLRNPYAAASSLATRSGHSIRFGLNLWEAYHRNLLRSLHGMPFLVTHYDAFRVDPLAELARVAGFAGLEPAAEAREAAALRVRRRHRFDLGDDMRQLQQHAGAATIELYDEFRQHAGPTFQSLPENFVPIAKPARTDRDMTSEVAPNRDRGAEEAALLRLRLTDEIKHREAVERSLAAQLAAKLLSVGQLSPAKDEVCLDFQLGGQAHQFTLGGWSVPEPHGTWTDGTSAAVALPPLAVPEGSKVTLDLWASPFLKEGRAFQSVTAMLDGYPIAKWDVTEYSELKATFDAVHLAARGARLELLVSEPAAPIDEQRSTDYRQLGLLVKTISVKVAPADR